MRRKEGEKKSPDKGLGHDWMWGTENRLEKSLREMPGVLTDAKLGDAAGDCFQEVKSWPSCKEPSKGDWPGAPSPLQGPSVEDDEGGGWWSLVGRS